MAYWSVAPARTLRWPNAALIPGDAARAAHVEDDDVGLHLFGSIPMPGTCASPSARYRAFLVVAV